MSDSRVLRLVYSGRVRRALQMAELAHRGQSRKSDPPAPYFLHLVAVTSVLAAVGADDDLLCAGYLHDAVEDTGMTLTAVEDEFGSRVAGLVDAVTKVRRRGQTKEEIHGETEQKMQDSESADAVALKGADLLANISDLVLDYRMHGYSHWEQVFKGRDRADFKVSHYLRLADIITGSLQKFSAYPVLVAHLHERAAELSKLYEQWERP